MGQVTQASLAKPGRKQKEILNEAEFGQTVPHYGVGLSRQ
jgi:hypothetical protein